MATQITRALAEPTKAQRASLFERWMNKVVRHGGDKGCWEWVGAKSLKRNGKRGVIRVGGRSGRILSAARVGKILATGAKFNDAAIAARELLHCPVTCTNGGGGTIDCVNPRHTRWGTRVENEHDKKRGVKRGKTKR